MNEIKMDERITTRLTRGQAIRKYCLDCSDDNPRNVTQCAFTDCQLYPFRKSGTTGSRTKAIKRYCFEHCMNRNMYEVIHCQATSCFLWDYRISKASDGIIPISRYKIETPRGKTPENGSINGNIMRRTK